MPPGAGERGHPYWSGSHSCPWLGLPTQVLSRGRSVRVSTTDEQRFLSTWPAEAVASD